MQRHHNSWIAPQGITMLIYSVNCLTQEVNLFKASLKGFRLCRTTCTTFEKEIKTQNPLGKALLPPKIPTRSIESKKKQFNIDSN